MSNDKESRLGRGVGALFSEEPEIVSEDTEVEPEVRTEADDSRVDLVKLRHAVNEIGKGKPVTSVWNRQIKVVLRYLFLTVPGFKESVEAQKILEEALKEKYPEVWEKVQLALS